MKWCNISYNQQDHFCSFKLIRTVHGKKLHEHSSWVITFFKNHRLQLARNYPFYSGTIFTYSILENNPNSTCTTPLKNQHNSSKKPTQKQTYKICRNGNGNEYFLCSFTFEQVFKYLVRHRAVSEVVWKVTTITPL